MGTIMAVALPKVHCNTLQSQVLCFPDTQVPKEHSPPHQESPVPAPCAGNRCTLQSNQLRDHFRWQGDAVTALQHAAEVLATMLPLMHAHGAVMHAKKLCYWAKLYFGCPRLCASRLLDLIVAGLLSWGVRGHQFLRYTC